MDSEEILKEILTSVGISEVSNLNQRIEKLNENAYLDLSNLNISALPEDLFEPYEFILHLDISGNQIVTLPSKIFYPLINLITLDMSNTLTPIGLKDDEPLSLPENLFERQANLILLDLSGNQIEFLPDGIFDKLYNLEVLNLRDNFLALLPTSIGNCINLEDLYMEGNFLPIDFKETYSGYLEVQEFLAPFSNAWNSMNYSDTIKNDIVDVEKEVEFDEEAEKIENELKKAFEFLDKI